MEPKLREFIIKCGFANPDELSEGQVTFFKAQWERENAKPPVKTSTVTPPAPTSDPEPDIEAKLAEKAAAEEQRIDGIRAVYNEFAPVLAKKKVCIGGEELDIAAAKRHAISKKLAPEDF